MSDAQHLGPEYRTAYAVWWAKQQILRIEREAFIRTYCRDKNKEQPMTEKKKDTTDGQPPDPEMEGRGAPKPINPETGQHGAYYVLPEEERAKGFVRPLRHKYIHKTCDTETRMGQALSETYARDPGFYGSTFCCECKDHFPVAEFTWSGTEEPVGS